MALGATLVLAWSAIGHQSGSGWVQAVGALVAAVLVIGFVVPPVALLRAKVSVASSPTDAEAGVPFVVILSCSRPVRLTPRVPGGEICVGAPGSPANLRLRCDTRGVLTYLQVSVASAAPFGLVWWSRSVEIPLPRPVHVAPRLGTPLPEICSGLERGGAATRHARAISGELHSVRGYQHGDSPRSVHWPATAHAATLMVRENDSPAGRTIVVRADLPPDPEAGERRAEHVFGTVVQLLDAGRSVVLETFEAAAGATSDKVADRLSTGRRLARAVGPNPETPGSGRASTLGTL